MDGQSDGEGHGPVCRLDGDDAGEVTALIICSAVRAHDAGVHARCGPVREVTWVRSVRAAGEIELRRAGSAECCVAREATAEDGWQRAASSCRGGRPPRNILTGGLP